jgi:predicted histone-like DNA-binding protein
MEIYIVHKKLTVGPHKGKRCFTLSRGPRRNIASGNLLEGIENATTLSFADGEMIFRSLVEVVTEKASPGHSVDLGPLGTIKPTIKATGVENRKDCNAKTITNRGVQFIARAELNERLKNMSLRVVNSKVRNKQ